MGNPDQPRDERGRWGEGSGGAIESIRGQMSISGGGGNKTIADARRLGMPKLANHRERAERVKAEATKAELKTTVPESVKHLEGLVRNGAAGMGAFRKLAEHRTAIRGLESRKLDRSRR